MKNFLAKITQSVLVVFVLIILLPVSVWSQGFQKAYGNALDNTFRKVVPNGSFYYVIGSDEPSQGALPRGTVTYLNIDGVLQWTKRLGISSVIMDGVITSGGDLLIVGSTLPEGETSMSIMGSISPTGNFNWVNTYDVPGSESLLKIVESPNPDNPAHPFVVAGTQADSSGNTVDDDGILLTLNEFGEIGWRKVFFIPGDNELTHDLEVRPNGDLMLAGNLNGHGAILWLNNAGEHISAGSPEIPGYSFTDLALSTDNGFYAVGGTTSNFSAYLSKFDAELLNVYDIEIENLTSISQVWQDAISEELYIVGEMVIGSLNRAVIMNFQDNGSDITLNWHKYLGNTETSYQGGSIWFIEPDWLAYVDDVVSPVGFGKRCARISVSDLDLTTCLTWQGTIDVNLDTWLYNSPDLQPAQFYDVPQGAGLTSSSITWQEQSMCLSDTCFAEFTFDIECGEVSFFDQSSLPNNPDWDWTFQGGNPSSSNAQNPIVNFPCGSYQVCLTISSSDPNSCSSTICHTVVISDNVPPVVECSGISVEILPGNCEAEITPASVGAAFDNCLIQSTSISPSIITNCGFTPVTFTATDWCGNTSSCTTSVYALEGEPPVVTCRPNVVVTGNGPAPCTAVVDGLSYLSASDNCELVDVSYQITGSTTGTGQDASGTTFNQGFSTITYTATDACGNTSTCSFTVTVLCETPGCCPEFSLLQLGDIMPCNNDSTCLGDTSSHFPMQGATSTLIACKNSLQTYYVIPNLPGFTYTWLITGGTLTSLQGSNPGIVTWGNGNQGFIQVIIMDVTGACRDTVSHKVCLIDAPVAAFTILPGNTVCTNQPVTFTNSSVGATGYFWDFGDGTGSTLQNPPPHSYSIPGPYTVILTVTNNTLLHPDSQCGCLDTATAVITVLAGEGPTITSHCKQMLCPGDTTTYCVSSGCAPYNWTVNGGTIIINNGACITVQWNATVPATLPASVSVTTGCGTACGNSATLNVPVLWNAIPISGRTPVCVGSTEIYSLPTMPGTFYTWTVTGGGGTIVSPNQNTPSINVQWNGPVGTATITCNYNNPYSGCSGTSSLTVEVKNKFTINGPASVCANSQRVYNVQPSGTANWTISPATGYNIIGGTNGVANIIVNWITPGNYTITATASPSVFCNLSSTFNVLVKPVPTINIIGPITICPNQVLNYTASSNLSGTNFNWTLIGGGTVSAYGPDNSNASVIFTGSGTWTLLATQNVNGCPGSATISIADEPGPTLPATPLIYCIGGQVTVSVLPGSTGPYTWSSSPAASLISGQGTGTATYEIHGTGFITVSNCNGVSNAISVTATPPPAISITQTGSLCGANLQLSAPAGGTAYLWYGGSSATTQTISVTVPGTYTVKVTLPGGCISVATHTVPPEAIPTVSISTGDPLGWCIPATPMVTLQAYTLSTGCTYQWHDANGAITGATGSTYFTTLPGNYFVIVTCGLCVATSNTITVYTLTCNPPPGTCIGVPNPLGAITASPCNPKTFSVNVNGCSGGVVNWNFGDGNTASGTPFIHTYANPGAYLVTADIVCNNCAFLVHTNVNVPVVADFNSSVVCGANGSYTINLSNTSQTLGGWTVANPTDITWTSNCGSPLSGSGNTFSITTTPGCNPNVTMVIKVTNSTTGQTCTDTKSFQFTLPTAPLSINGPNRVCKNETNSFFSSMTGPNIIQYEWTVNGTPVSQVHPLSYAFDGNPVNPVVGLTVVDIYGCTFMSTLPLTVVMPRTLSIAPVEICPDCLPPASLIATPSAGFINFQWYHNGIPVGSNIPTHQLCQFDASGNYYVTAEDSQNNNCDVISNTVQVVYLPKPQANIQGSTIQCVTGSGPYIISLNYTASNNPNYVYNWTATGPGGITFIPNNLLYYADASVTQLGTYQFILMVTDITTGCMAKDTFCVYLFQNPSVTISGPGGVLCEGTPYTFTATATPAANYIYQWSNGATGPTMTTSLAGLFSVTATNPESGCNGTAYSSLIRPQPQTILFPVGCDSICDNESITPPLPLGGNWFPSLYTVQWFINGNPTPFFTGSVLNLGGNIPPPLVYGWNDIYIVVTYNGCSTTSNIYHLYIRKCCVCTSDLFLGHGGNVFPIPCDSMGFIPSFPCPAEDIVISGFFGFSDPATGEPCEETVFWELLRPNNTTLSGISNNYSIYIFLKESVEPPGTYCLTLTTISPTGDTCVCRVKWIQEPCACCTTLDDFCDRIENNVILTVDNNTCKATLDIGNLNGCDDYIEWVDWNFPSQQEGPFFPGTMPMHTYTASGTYTVCYLAIERDVNGFICFEKVICDTITVECPGCFCGMFDGLFFPFGRNIQGVQPFCGGPEVTVECPTAGQSILFTGSLHCAGTACPTAPVSWGLYRLPNTTIPIASGSTNANPYFGINILPAWYAIPGSYELRLIGLCGLQECPCIVKFKVACPEPCPCDVPALSAAVSQGFNVIQATNSCQACFSPIALSDCETVNWYLNNTGGTPIGTSVGNNTFCHAFVGPGSYTVFMVVNRKKPDGTDCETFVYSKTVIITCLSLPDCTHSIFRNATFSEGAVAGELGVEGMSEGWTSILGNPNVIEGEAGSPDGWTMELWGNLNTASILTSTESMCLARDTGEITLRFGIRESGPGPNRPCDKLKIQFYQGDNFELNDCGNPDCYEIASISLADLSSDEWYEAQFHYDLRQWMPLDSCGDGVIVKPIVYVTNGLISNQGGEETYSVIQVDKLCVEGTIVALHDPERKQNLRVFPNPTNSTLNVELPFTAQTGMSLQIVNLTGQVLMEKKVEVGTTVQTMEVNPIVDGMYLLQIISDGRIIALNKFVKM